MQSRLNGDFMKGHLQKFYHRYEIKNISDVLNILLDIHALPRCLTFESFMINKYLNPKLLFYNMNHKKDLIKNNLCYSLKTQISISNMQ